MKYFDRDIYYDCPDGGYHVTNTTGPTLRHSVSTSCVLWGWLRFRRSKGAGSNEEITKLGVRHKMSGISREACASGPGLAMSQKVVLLSTSSHSRICVDEVNKHMHQQCIQCSVCTQVVLRQFITNADYKCQPVHLNTAPCCPCSICWGSLQTSRQTWGQGLY